MTESSAHEVKRVTRENLFANGGKTGALMQVFNWSETPIGSVELWPRSLQIALRILLSSKFPMQILWGPEYIQFYNDAYIPIAGKKHPTGIGQRGKECWQEVWDFSGPLLDRVMRTGEATWSEDQLLVLNRYGTPQECYFTFSYSPIWNDDSETVGGIFIAVTETTHKILSERRERLLLAEAQAARESLERVLASINDEFMMFDQQWRFSYVNEKAAKGFGKSSKELIGQSIWELFPYMIDTSFYQDLCQAMDKQVVTHFEYFCPLTNQWWENRVYPFSDGLSLLRVDITQRRKTELELSQAKEAAETANQVKDQFLAILSHELRSPLNPILGWAKLLRLQKLDAATTARALETIERNAKLQAQMIEDLLDVSRILQGKLAFNSDPVDLVMVIEDAIEIVRSAANNKSIQIQTQLDYRQFYTLGDASRLKQVVWNLLSNAVKFTPQKGQITITLEYINSYAQIQVIDTGKGISADFLPYVFDRFRQADSTTTRVFGGLGLGLAIAQQIVDMHNGVIYANSLGPGQGATFTVKLPLTSLHPTPTQEENQPTDSVDLENLQILVVDDDQDSRDFITFVLQQRGAKVTAVPSAKAAMNALLQFTPDVLISDIGMPDIDGYTLMTQMRKLTPTHQIPAIALTAYASELDQQKAIASGFHKHLVKPIETTKLISAIVTLVTYSQP